MATLDRNGVQIYHEIHGRGPALLLTHGYSATCAMWRGQVEPLSRAHTLILWDMRGHGQSDSPEQPAAYSEAETIADMAALLDLAGAQSAIIGGLSLGGYMSLAFHYAHPGRTRALLIFDTGPGFRRDDAREAWNERALETASQLETRGLEHLSSLSAERRTSQHRSAAGLARAARGMLTQQGPHVINSLPSIAVPTLILAGADDQPFLAATDYMAAKIPGAQKVLIPKAGHAVNLDQPAAFNQAVQRFLDGLA